ncbi:MAG: hypothetical protein ACTSPI_16760 [Candidatus Heimdallarchaeaceae archaeon]
MTIVECGSIDCKHCSREGICTLDKIRMFYEKKSFLGEGKKRNDRI